MRVLGSGHRSRSVRPGPVRLALAAGAGYLLGAMPSADLASRVAARRSGNGPVDLRDHGSGNPGATNAAAVLGSAWGAAVLAADVAKGAAAGTLGRAVAGDAGGYLAATTAIAGHVWPATASFRGGKGVATSVGSCLAVFPAYVPIDAAVAAVSVVRAGRAEMSMRITAPIWVLGAYAWWRLDLPNAWGPRPSRGLVGFAAVSTAVILYAFGRSRPPAPRPDARSVSKAEPGEGPT